MKCRECSVNIVNDENEYYCPECGEVYGQVLEQPKFYSQTNNETKKKDRRMADRTLGSFVSKGGGYKLRRLAVWHQTGDRAVKEGNFYCSIVAAELNFTSEMKELMEDYYKKLRENHVFTCHMKFEERAAALAYIVLRTYSLSVTLQEISKILEIPTKRVSKLSRVFARELKIPHIFSMYNIPSLIEKNCRTLGLDGYFMELVNKLYLYLENVEFKQPTTAYLASLVYLVETTMVTKTLSQGRVAEVFGTTVTTLRLHYKDTLKKLGLESTFGLSIDEIVAGVR